MLRAVTTAQNVKDAPAKAVLDLAQRYLSRDSAAAMKAIGGWDESRPMAFHVAHVGSVERSESETRVNALSSAWLTALPDHRGDGVWEVEIRRAPCGWAALHQAVHELESVVLVAADIDWTMPFSDAYGHQEGDLMLTRVHRAVEKIAMEHGGRFMMMFALAWS